MATKKNCSGDVVLCLGNLPPLFKLKGDIFVFVQNRCSLVHISVLMRRDIIEKLGGYNEEYDVLADYELWSKLIKKGYQLGNLREILAGYMVSPESFGSKHSMRKSLLEASRII